ncbi:MAG: hypothetical protein UEB92_01665, partial [Clostridia bacterium]|nr:hypothetical protein [Clostridia bacterium]
MSKNKLFSYRMSEGKKKTGSENDMYPLSWTPRREGVFMRYSYEFKLECIELYRQGVWPETPEGVTAKR